MVHKITFDSQNNPNGELLVLASGYVSDNEILFVHEKIIVQIESKTGAVAFCNEQGNVLQAAKAELPQTGDEKFSEVHCAVSEDLIKLGFPQYTYEDNYPHCDGEHDRWTKRISGYRFVCYNYKNNCIV